MRIKPAVGLVVGQTSGTHWGQALLTPFAYGVVEIQDLYGSNARELGIQLLTKLTHDLSGDKNIVSLSDLEELAEKVASDKLVSLILLLPVGKTVYLVVKGEGKAYLKRDGKLAVLLSGQGSISGEVSKGDIVVLESRGFASVCPDDLLLSIFDHLSVREISEKLTLMLHEKPDGMGEAGLIFQIAEFIENEDERREVNTKAVVPKKAGMVSGFFHRHSLARITKVSKKKTPFIIMLVLAGLFAVSVVLGIIKQQQSSRNNGNTKIMADAKFAFDEGTALLALNPVKGRERLRYAKNILTPIISSVSDKSQEGRDIRQLYQQIDENLTEAMHIAKVKPDLYYDVSLLKAGARADRISIEGDFVGILDRNAATVYGMSLSTKSGKMLASGGDLSGSKYIASQANGTYVFSGNGIIFVDGSDKKASVAVRKMPEWGIISQMSMFGGNIYLLDTEKGRIWKYVAGSAETGGPVSFSDTRQYLDPDSFPDLSASISMSIDGSVWIGTNDGRIIKLTGGKEDSFRTQGIDPALGGHLDVFTSDADTNIYILDIQNKRVVAIDKSGMYLAQYVWDDSLGITDFAVSETAKQILLVSEGKIYTIGLK